MQTVAAPTQQKDDFCGPFCVARILGLDQDEVAREAGTRLPHASARPGVPDGARSLTDYRYDVPRVPDAESGTSPQGLVGAIERLTDGRLTAVPIRGQWTAARVEGLVDQAPAFGARLIANLRTGGIWGSRPTAQQLLAELAGEEVAGPPPDWDVGHFVELTTLVSGHRGSLVVIHDTYPTLGLDGFHLQPPRAVARALLRGDGREGGVLAVVRAGGRRSVEAMALELGLEIGVWDNGCRS